MNPDTVRALTAAVVGLLAGGWLIVAVKAQRMPPPKLGPWTLRAMAGFFLLLAYATLNSLLVRRGMPLSSPILLTVIALVLMVGMSWAILRDFLRRKRH
jgi:drug/metabolite transporter (DMT)-like permease